MHPYFSLSQLNNKGNLRFLLHGPTSSLRCQVSVCVNTHQKYDWSYKQKENDEQFNNNKKNPFFLETVTVSTQRKLFFVVVVEIMNTKPSKHVGTLNTEQNNLYWKKETATQTEAASKIQQPVWCQITISGHLNYVCVCACVCMCGGERVAGVHFLFFCSIFPTRGLLFSN